MSNSPGGMDRRVIDLLLAEPALFDGFSAVGLLEAWAFEEAGGHASPERTLLGFGKDPTLECVRFHASDSLRHPHAAIASVERNEEDVGFHVVWALFGLFGPLGALPDHYTRLIIARRREGDHGLRRFLDLFNHHLAALYYRAWAKYRLPENAFAAWERTPEGTQEPLRQALFSLQGMGSPRERRRLDLREEILLFYAGALQPNPRSMVGLLDLLEDAFRARFEIEDFLGQWLDLAEEDRSAMPTRARPEGQHARLGIDFVTGSRVWDAQTYFRVRVGPLSFERYRDFTPGHRALEALISLVKTYVGMGLDFGIRPVLKKEEIPPCRLGAPHPQAPRLGRTTWLQSAPAEEDFDGVVFPVRTP